MALTKGKREEEEEEEERRRKEEWMGERMSSLFFISKLRTMDNGSRSIYFIGRENEREREREREREEREKEFG
uniref:Uncharacterized protein n=1 Tax=Nelumbo nucifera TaxID=4432 RepID=A0A822ZNJ6_NELNU|nr:TPA_asm: hypothetical protein HUJ06_004260 [Nelumbo nucifera]